MRPNPRSALGRRLAPAAELAGRHVLSAHGRQDVITPVAHGQQNPRLCQELIARRGNTAILAENDRNAARLLCKSLRNGSQWPPMTV